MAPASAKSMAMANANAQTADMNRIEDNPRRMGNYESGLAAVVKAAIRTSLSQDFAPTEPRAHRTSLIDQLRFRSNGYPDFALTRPPRLRHITHPIPSHCPLHEMSNGYPDRLFSRRTEPFPVPPTQPHGQTELARPGAL